MRRLPAGLRRGTAVDIRATVFNLTVGLMIWAFAPERNARELFALVVLFRGHRAQLDVYRDMYSHDDGRGLSFHLRLPGLVLRNDESQRQVELGRTPDGATSFRIERVWELRVAGKRILPRLSF